MVQRAMTMWERTWMDTRMCRQQMREGMRI